MRVHLRNVVYSALERGLVMGYHRVNKLPKHQQKNKDSVINAVMKSLWESLDKVIDFRDDETEEKDEPLERAIGFQSVDAVATNVVKPKEDKDNADDSISLDVLYRYK